MKLIKLILLALVVGAGVLYSSSLKAQNVAVLSEADEQVYRRIFTAQEKEDWQTADKYIKKLTDTSLMGHVLAQRYFSKTWRTKSAEIEAWFKKYADYPEASRMYSLGQKKKAKLPKQQPTPLYGGKSGTCSAIYRAEPINSIESLNFSYLSKDKRKQAQKLMRQIVRYIKAGRTLNAKQVIDSPEAKVLFSAKDHDAARIALSFSYFLDGMDNRVFEMGQKAVARSGHRLPLGHWTLGLSAWRMGDIEKAADHFDKVVQYSSAPLLKSAGAYWASRANLKLGKFERVNEYLETAAESSRTFYGIMATRALGRDLNHAWEKPVLPDDDVTESFSHPTFERALALKQIGQEKLAERVLAKLFLKADKQTRALLMAVAEKNGIAADLSAIAGNLKNDSPSQRYPAPDWQPEKKGWVVDKALVFSFVKQESCFNEKAQSAVGAVGLMQLMPSSARQIAHRLRLEWDKKKLTEPEYNLALGQQYLIWLMSDKQIDNNLLFTAVAYNSGPGNLYKLKKKMKYNDDPLLFVESIPFRETRGFVERIMANYWIYQTLMNQPVPSLDALIEGCWPMYVGQDTPAQCDKPENKP